MKSLKEFSMNLPEKDYHLYPAWSYSMISHYAKDGFASLPTLHTQIEQTPAMRFGSLFDSILTRGKATLDDFAVSDQDVPPARKAVLDRLAELSKEKDFALVPEELIKQALADCDYQAAKKYETQYAHLEAFANYYNLKKSGKTLVTKDEWDDAVQMARIMRDDEYHRNIFRVNGDDGFEYLYQLQFKTNLTLSDGQVVEVKIMPDLLIVNHNAKNIRPVDLKTSTCPSFEFPDQWVRMRYDLQASFYTDVLRKVLDDNGYADYDILPYLFTDISRSDMVPATFEYDPHDESQLAGLSFSKGDKTYQYKGWDALLKEILHYESISARVPDYISTSSANNLLDILAR